MDSTIKRTIFSFAGTVRTDEARVLDVSRRHILLALNPSCGTDLSCGVCSSCKESNAIPKLRLPLPRQPHFECGQKVTVERFEVNQGVSAMILFGLPLIFAFAAALIADAASRGMSLQSVFSVCASLGGMALGFALGAAVDALIRRTYPAHITPLPV
jgi:positive regulator of sigma E activity